MSSINTNSCEETLREISTETVQISSDLKMLRMKEVCRLGSQYSDFKNIYIVQSNNYHLLSNVKISNEFSEIGDLFIIENGITVNKMENMRYALEYNILCIKDHHKVQFMFLSSQKIINAEILYINQYKSGLWKDNIKFIETNKKNICVLISKYHIGKKLRYETKCFVFTNGGEKIYISNKYDNIASVINNYDSIVNNLLLIMYGLVGRNDDTTYGYLIVDELNFVHLPSNFSYLLTDNNKAYFVEYKTDHKRILEL
jgi:hypothetical protein